MTEGAIQVRTGGAVLEALYGAGNGSDAVVLCHPHPLYGGSLHNNVISTMQMTFSRLGWSTLRFNSRGVGGSSGKYEGGEAEADDLIKIADFLREKGKTAIHLGGYSFGAWVSLKAIRKGLHAESVTLVSPPLDFMDFTGLSVPDARCLIVAGDRDDFCSTASLRDWLSGSEESGRNFELVILPGCDHFYSGFEDALYEKLRSFFGRRSGHTPPAT